MAEKAAAEKEAQEVEAQRQQDLQKYNHNINTEKVFGQILYELCVKALSAPLATSSGQSQKAKVSSKPADEKKKQQARFL